MPRYIKKLFVSFLVGIIVLMSVAPAAPARAADNWYSQSFGSWYSKVHDEGNPNEIFGERYTAAQVQWVVYGFVSLFIDKILLSAGCSPGSLNALFTGNVSVFNCNVTSSLVSPRLAEDTKNESLFSAVFADRQLSGVTYVRDIGRKFHLIPVANAQSAGFGYGALEPIRSMAVATRDISYVFFVIILLVMSFMIMFRVKISPQVVVTIQSALPRVVIALVIVTFSYAIAGFLVDLMYVAIGLLSIVFSSIFSAAGISNALGGIIPDTTPIGLFRILTQGFFDTGIFGFLIVYFLAFLLAFLIIVVVIVNNAFAALTIPGIVAGTGFAMIGVLVAVVLFIGMFIILLFMSVKILMTLIRAFVMILLLTIVMPLQITLGVVMPSIGFGSWIRLFIANLAVFPITGALFILSFLFMGQAVSYAQSNFVTFSGLGQVNIFSTGVVTPPTNNNAGWPPLVGVTAGGTALALLFGSFFIMSMVPKAAEVATGLVTGKFNFGNAIGEAVQPVRGAASYVATERETAASLAAGVKVNAGWAQFLRTVGIIR